MHLIRELFKFDAPSDKLLSNFFRSNRKLSSSERSLIAETAYTILRNYYKLTLVLDNDIPNIIGLTWLKLMQLKASSFAAIKLIDYQKISKIEFQTDALSTLELPEWLITELEQSYSKNDIAKLAQSLQQEAPLDLRVNLLKNNRATVLQELQEFSPSKMEFSPFGIRINNKTFLAKHKLFIDGCIEVQDESSQLAGLLLNPKRNEIVVDFCAGSGGKALLFGMLMRNSGHIYAFDVNQKRLNNLTPRMNRSGLTNTHSTLIDSEFDTKLHRLYNKIDRVFVDAPCSGLGTLRRNPELKFRQSLHSIEELNIKQMSILQEASKLLKPGGHLVYATCSIVKAENQDIVEQFLLFNPDFTLVPATQVLSNPKLKQNDSYLTLLPHIHHCDGFFAALLQKKH